MQRIVTATLCTVFLCAASAAPAPIAGMPFADVPTGAWYAHAVRVLLSKGYVDATQKNFRPADTTTRAEFLKMLLTLNGTSASTPPLIASFDDADAKDWFYAILEEAAKQGWMLGDGKCYGTHPCKAHPNAPLTRAEAAVLLTRARGWDPTGKAPRFIDSDTKVWYGYAIQAAADRCILSGDPLTMQVHPYDSMTRAQMAVMLARATMDLQYGKDCGVAR